MVYLRLFRFHQWIKNLLLFVPVVAGHQLSDHMLLAQVGWAFISFSFCASAVYIINDLVDVEYDRTHPTKKNRPFASRQVPPVHGVIIAVLLLFGSTFIAFQLPMQFMISLAIYFIITLAYTVKLKSIALMDVLLLAGLYTIRIIAGSKVAYIDLSFWLLTFSIFVFLSLALVKRYSEMLLMQSIQQPAIRGRGYTASDLPLLLTMGIGSGFMSVLVLALYIDSPNIRQLYGHPELVWLLCPLFLYWISRVWLITHRGHMHDDPVVFALRDYASLVIAALGAVILWMAT